MAMTPNSIITPQSIKTGGVAIVNADSTNKKTLYTGAANGSKLESISITSTDTVARVLNIYHTIGGTDYFVGTVNVPITAGTDAAITAAVSVLESNLMLPWIRYDSNGRGYLYLANGDILKFAAQVAVTAAKEIDIVCQGGDY